ncbi:hypothetical protein QFC19_009284 [Naganishia cerealis]|uniref:Uncharacterized protein n=1 Tax=Naganishia cerealis TaxID=610337 RepID=A0ACC2UWA4_9TREE|nr:hypothetical protein QFC19_009284 [Naganishia cerealis]
MSIVNIRNIQLLNNPARWEDDYNFRITFECVEPLKEGKQMDPLASSRSGLAWIMTPAMTGHAHPVLLLAHRVDIEWRLLYVGDAKSEEYDQELDSCMVGPVPVGVNSFDFTAAAPQPHLLPSTSSEEILGVTVLILTASYRDKEFVRVGYYVNTEYEDEERRLEPPAVVDFKGLIRNVLVAKPRVTRFSNPWDSDAKTLSNPWANTVSLDSLSAGGAPNGGVEEGTQSLDAPITTSHANPSDNIYNSPLPPPIQQVVAAPSSERAVDVEMS